MKRKQLSTYKEGLHIIIVGCGKVGVTLIEQLSREGHDITAIDKNMKKIQYITGLFDIMGIVGNGASYNVQMEADIEHADLIIAVTDSDELNLLCCTVAKRVGDCSAIARVRNPDYSEEISYFREKLGIAIIINPELEAAHEMARILYLPTALEVNTFFHGRTQLIKFRIPADNPLEGRTIADLSGMGKFHENVLVCAIEREDKVYIPNGNFKLMAGDEISYIASRSIAREFLRTVNLKTKKVQNTMIIGGGKAAYYLAKQLLSMNINVKIIEQDKKRCEKLSLLLPNAIIINGDGTDEDLLKEEGIEYMESFIPLTGIDETNILLTLHAKEISDAKIITKLNRNNFKTAIRHLSLGSVVYPRYITCEAIISYVRAKKASINSNIETLYHMFDFKVEAIEFKVKEESQITNTPLIDLNLKDELLIACISRKGRTIIPNGQDSIQVGDSVIIVTTHTGFNDIQDIMK